MTDANAVRNELKLQISGFVGYSVSHHNIGIGLIEAAQAALALLDEREREIARLHELHAEAEQEYVQWRNRASTMQNERDAARAEVEALRADAKRYRWLRANASNTLEIRRYGAGDRWYYPRGEALDTFVDAAITEQEKNNAGT